MKNKIDTNSLKIHVVYVEYTFCPHADKTGAAKEEISREISRLYQLTEHAHIARIKGFCRRKGTFNSLFLGPV